MTKANARTKTFSETQQDRERIPKVNGDANYSGDKNTFENHEAKNAICNFVEKTFTVKSTEKLRDPI